MADVTRRMLALLATLQGGRPFTGEELARRLDVSPRTVRRDVDRLRGYGYPVDTRPGPGGHYQLAAGTAMPPLVLDDDEAVAALLALSALAATDAGVDGSLGTAAARAYGKVDQYLPRRLRATAAAMRAGLETSSINAPATDAGVLAELATAIASRRHVELRYERRGVVTDRVVEPYRQIHRHLRWYLLAWDVAKNDWRVFRADRIAAVRTRATSFEPRPLPAATASAYVAGGMGRDRRRVVVLVQAPPSDVAAALTHQDAELHALGEHSTRVVVRLDDWRWLLLNLAFLDADFTVEEPAEFREELRRFAHRVLGAEESPSSTGPLGRGHRLEAMGARTSDGSAGDADYGRIGAGYRDYRQPEPEFEQAIVRALGDARTVLNVGAGTGSYEPTDRDVTAVEPSESMRSQRPAHLARAIDATAEALPFPDGAFDAAMTTFSVHQWSDLRAGLAELRRVTRGPIVVMTCDPARLDRFWLTRYAPEVIATEARRYPRLADIASALGGPVDEVPLPIPLHCRDGFSEAYYGRPEFFLDPGARLANSAWSFVPAERAEAAVRGLRRDLESGAWDARHRALRSAPHFDGSLVLLVANA